MQVNEANLIGAKCHICQSIKHFAARCPRRKVANTSVNITLYSGQAGWEQCFLKSIGYGVLDSACTKTVAAELWMQEYLASLTDEERSTVESSQKKSLSTYRFGDGVESKSLECFNLPTVIGKEKVSIEVDVVENKIPLLISKPTMTKLGMKLDFENHEVTVGDQTMKLNTTSSGHYCLPISYMTKQECNVTNAERVIGSTLEE